MQIEYLIKYSNRKTLNITVERDRQVIVHAPANLSEDKIREIVSSKKDWIMGKLMHVQKYPAVASAKEFVSGEALMYLGKNYQLLIVDAEIEGIELDKQFKISKKIKPSRMTCLSNGIKLKLSKKFSLLP
jgi:Protein of unknown function DUF45.